MEFLAAKRQPLYFVCKLVRQSCKFCTYDFHLCVYVSLVKEKVQSPQQVLMGGTGNKFITIYWSDELKALIGPQFAFPSSNMLMDSVDSR